MNGRQTVSRILYPSLSARAAIIHLGLRSPESSSSLPGNYYGGPAMFPYLALLHVGFTKPTRYRIAGALLPHLFTLTGNRSPRRYIFCGTFRPLRALALRGTLPCGVRTFLEVSLAITRLPANPMILCS